MHRQIGVEPVNDPGLAEPPLDAITATDAREGSETATYRSSRLDRGQANLVVGAAALVVVLALALFAAQLNSTQAGTRRRVLSGFHERTQVLSELTQAVLASASSVAASEVAQPDASSAASGRTLDQLVAQTHLAYAVLFDGHGRVIASSKGLTSGARTRVLASGTLRRVLDGAPDWLSDVFGAGGGAGIIDVGAPLTTAAGRDAVVIGVPAAVLSSFLGGYLPRIPTPGGSAYVVDSHGIVVGSRSSRQRVGEPVAEGGLLDAVQRGASGSYGGDRYFESVAVPDSTWRVLLTSSKASLFSSVSGSRKWLPWLIYVALGLVAAGFLVVLRRLLGSAVALSRANSQLAGSNARLKSMNALLRRAAELSRSNAELEQFASVASHDLQEPLRKVQTFAAQLTATERDRLSEQGQDFLRRMSDAAGRMRTLIDDLLMFSRVSTKGRPFVAVDLGGVVAQVLVDLEMSIMDSGARITVEALPTVQADPVQMRQLLQNLLGNALKFRRKDIVPELRVSAEVSEHVAELTIRDNGIGFDEQYASRIFGAFERLHGAREYPGTGIGLALCRKIVERHHGAITSEGEVGVGASFTVRLPLDQPADEPPSTSLFPDLNGHEEEAGHALV